MDNEAADTTALKEAFALQLLLHPNDPLKAACQIGVTNMFARFVAEYWTDDLYVRIVKKKLLDEHGHAFFLPNVFDIAHRLLTIADDANHPENKLKALRQYSELMGMVAKPGALFVDNRTTNTVNNTQTNNVMVIKDHGSEADWERRLIENQTGLLASADK